MIISTFLRAHQNKFYSPEDVTRFFEELSEEDEIIIENNNSNSSKLLEDEDDKQPILNVNDFEIYFGKNCETF